MATKKRAVKKVATGKKPAKKTTSKPKAERWNKKLTSLVSQKKKARTRTEANGIQKKINAEYKRLGLDMKGRIIKIAKNVPEPKIVPVKKKALTKKQQRANKVKKAIESNPVVNGLKSAVKDLKKMKTRTADEVVKLVKHKGIKKSSTSRKRKGDDIKPVKLKDTELDKLPSRIATDEWLRKAGFEMQIKPIKERKVKSKMFDKIEKIKAKAKAKKAKANTKKKAKK